MQLSTRTLITTLAGLLMLSSQSTHAMSNPHIAFLVPEATAECPNSNIAATLSPDEPRRYECNDLVFTVSIPSECEQGGCGLILDQHGVLMNAENQNDGTHMRTMGWHAETRGADTPYIVVQPNLDRYLSGGEIYPGDFNKDKVLDFINQGLDAWQVDHARVHAVGFSQGTIDMVYKLQCENAQQFASLAMIAAVYDPMDCPLSQTPMFEIVGKYDVNYYALDVINRSRDNYRALMGEHVEEVIHQDSFWQIYGSGQHVHTRYEGNGYLYEYLVHSAVGGILQPLTLGFDGGHCLPDGHNADNYLREVVCYQANFRLGEKLIDFFIANPKP